MTRVNDQEQDFTHANYNYNLDEKKLEKLLGGKIDPKDLKMAKEVLGLIEEDYSGNVDFLNNYGENFIRNKIFPFTLASDELDSTFLSYRSTGQNMLTRAISEIQRVEKEICDEIFGFNELLKETSTNGKNDVSDILKSIHKMKHCVESMHGKEPAHKLAKIMSSLTISFFKRDTVGKAFFGLFGVGRTNSIAAEYAGGRSGAVWEWEAKEGDNFMCEMETKDILSRLPYEKNKKKELAPLWIKNPITGKMIKVPFLKTYKKHFQTTSKDVRKGFGADFKSIAFDMLNKWVPLLLAFILWKFISSAIKESSDEETK